MADTLYNLVQIWFIRKGQLRLERALVLQKLDDHKCRESHDIYLTTSLWVADALNNVDQIWLILKCQFRLERAVVLYCWMTTNIEKAKACNLQYNFTSSGWYTQQWRSDLAYSQRSVQTDCSWIWNSSLTQPPSHLPLPPPPPILSSIAKIYQLLQMLLPLSTLPNHQFFNR